MYGVKWMKQAKSWSTRGYMGKQWIVTAGIRAKPNYPNTGVAPDFAVQLNGAGFTAKQARRLAHLLITAAAMWETGD